MKVTIQPKASWRPGYRATVSLSGDTLSIDDGRNSYAVDLGGSWQVQEPDGDDPVFLVGGGIVREIDRDADGNPRVTLTAYQPQSRPIMGEQPPITLADGESVAFPDYLEPEDAA